MSARGLPNDDRLLELLALRAAEGLDAEAEQELGEWADCGDLDEAAAVLAIGMASAELEEMPLALRARLERMAADGFIAGSDGPGVAVRMNAPDQCPRTPLRRGGGGWLGAAGWLAAAACLLLAVIAWKPGRTPGTATPDERLAAMGAEPGVLKTAWLGLDDANLAATPHRFDQGLTGEVVWSDATNEGYMLLEGLAENDPGQYQYQLWIFDASRPTGDLPQFGDGILSQRPIDGGVFNADGPGRLVIPIDAKLRVGKAAIFAITVEPPGGVVVSDRDIVTLAVAP